MTICQAVSQFPCLIPAVLKCKRFGRRKRKQSCYRTACSSEDLPDPGSVEGAGGDLEKQLMSAARVYEAIEEYKLLLSQPDEKIDVLLGAALIAQHKYPLLDYELIEEQLDDLAVQVEAVLPPPESRYPLRVVQAISAHLFENRGFRGNTEDYYDTDNSCINRVLERRLGIPITLSLVYQEVARRVGLEMIGVNVPGHFFLAPAAQDTSFLVDAFQGGEVSFSQDVEATLEGIYQRPVRVSPELLEVKEPLPARSFLTRMLNNLKQIYVYKEDYASALLISRYLEATRPSDIDIIRDTGVFLYYLQRIQECKETLTHYLQLAPPDSEDANKIRRLLDSLN